MKDLDIWFMVCGTIKDLSPSHILTSAPVKRLTTVSCYSMRKCVYSRPPHTCGSAPADSQIATISPPPSNVPHFLRKSYIECVQHYFEDGGWGGAEKKDSPMQFNGHSYPRIFTMCDLANCRGRL